MSIITPIGIDHQAFLGESIEEIAATKIRSIQKKVLLAPQNYHEVPKIAQEIAQKKKAELFYAEHISLNDHKELEAIVQEKSWGEYLVDNAKVALKALEILGIEYDINDLKSLDLFGRFYPLTKNIRIDVGHNPLSSKCD
jgi:dihydrofolate synthase/folylpolyglutamate synthase